MVELRDWQTQADNPWLWIHIQRVFVGPCDESEAVTVLNLDGYEPDQTPEMGKPIRLASRDGMCPLVVYVPASEQVSRITWNAGKLELHCGQSHSHDLRIGMWIDAPEDLNATQLAAACCAEACEIRLDFDSGDAGELCVPSDTCCPGESCGKSCGESPVETVRAMRIVNPPAGPYWVCENNWWHPPCAAGGRRWDSDAHPPRLQPPTCSRVCPR